MNKSKEAIPSGGPLSFIHILDEIKKRNFYCCGPHYFPALWVFPFIFILDFFYFCRKFKILYFANFGLWDLNGGSNHLFLL